MPPKVRGIAVYVAIQIREGSRNEACDGDQQGESADAPTDDDADELAAP